MGIRRENGHTEGEDGGREEGRSPRSRQGMTVLALHEVSKIAPTCVTSGMQVSRRRGHYQGREVGVTHFRCAL